MKREKRGKIERERVREKRGKIEKERERDRLTSQAGLLCRCAAKAAKSEGYQKFVGSRDSLELSV